MKHSSSGHERILLLIALLASGSLIGCSGSDKVRHTVTEAPKIQNPSPKTAPVVNSQSLAKLDAGIKDDAQAIEREKMAHQSKEKAADRAHELALKAMDSQNLAAELGNDKDKALMENITALATMAGFYQAFGKNNCTSKDFFAGVSDAGRALGEALSFAKAAEAKTLSLNKNTAGTSIEPVHRPQTPPSPSGSMLGPDLSEGLLPPVPYRVMGAPRPPEVLGPPLPEELSRPTESQTSQNIPRTIVSPPEKFGPPLPGDAAMF